MSKWEQLLLLLAQLFTAYEQSGFSHPAMLGDQASPDDKAAALANAIVEGVAEKLSGGNATPAPPATPAKVKKPKKSDDEAAESDSD